MQQRQRIYPSPDSKRSDVPPLSRNTFCMHSSVVRFLGDFCTYCLFQIYPQHPQRYQICALAHMCLKCAKVTISKEFNAVISSVFH